MTAARTPSQRGRSNRNKGHTAERDLCKWLRTSGFPHAERAVRTGFRVGDRVSADPGDVTGTPGVVWSVKDVAAEQITVWLAELDTMAGDHYSVRLLVHKRRGHADPGRWWCWLRLNQLVPIADHCHDDVCCAPPHPVRMELGHVVDRLRWSGYGSPVEATS